MILEEDWAKKGFPLGGGGVMETTKKKVNPQGSSEMKPQVESHELTVGKKTKLSRRNSEVEKGESRHRGKNLCLKEERGEKDFVLKMVATEEEGPKNHRKILHGSGEISN